MGPKFSYLAIVAQISLMLTITLVAVSASPEDAKMYLNPISDTYIAKECPDCKSFNESELRVGMEAFKVVDPHVVSHVAYKVVLKGPYNTLLKFNLSEIPPGAKIKQARLWLYVKNPPNESINLLLYVLRQEFNASETTWLHRTSKALWKTPGGYAEPDYEVKIRVDESLNRGSSVGFLVTDYVKRVLEGDIEDYGIIIRPRVGKVSVSDFGSSNSMRLYVDFYSKEGAKRDLVSRYAPTLYVEFEKPTAEIHLSNTEISLERGQSQTVTVSESGTFAGQVGLAYRVVEAPGVKVGPLKIEVPEFDRSPGFSANLKITAWEYATPGKYVIEFYPDTGSYSSKVVEYKKAYLTVYVKGEMPSTQTASETVTETQTTTSPMTSTEIKPTTGPLTSSTPTQITTSAPQSSPMVTSGAPIVTTITQKTEVEGGNTMMTAALAAAVVILLILILYLLRVRR